MLFLVFKSPQTRFGFIEYSLETTLRVHRSISNEANTGPRVLGISINKESVKLQTQPSVLFLSGDDTDPRDSSDLLICGNLNFLEHCVFRVYVKPGWILLIISDYQRIQIPRSNYGSFRASMTCIIFNVRAESFQMTCLLTSSVTVVVRIQFNQGKQSRCPHQKQTPCVITRMHLDKMKMNCDQKGLIITISSLLKMGRLHSRRKTHLYQIKYNIAFMVEQIFYLGKEI